LSKAYLAPYGVGLGHASRLAMVAEQLHTSGVETMFSSFGEAVRYLTMHGFDCSISPEVEFAWSMEGGFSVKDSIANIPRWFVNFSKQMVHESHNLAKYDPDIILSDSRLSPILAGRLLKVPSVVVLNQIKLLLSPRLREFRAARIFERMNGEFLGVIWTAADRILVPDLPPPFTIAEHNVWEISSVSSRLEYIGFTTPRHLTSREQIDKVAKALEFDISKPIVFIHISGPHQTRMPVIRTAIEACKLFGPEIQFVISEGRAKGKIEPTRIAHSGWYYEWCPVRDEIFAMSSVIVLRGGHVAISQAIQLGKPIVTIPIDNHGEQLGNSEKVVKLGLGIMLRQKSLTADQIACAVHEVIQEPKYGEKATDMMKLAASLNGIDNIVKIIRSYL
jgi:UDP-N-acetylglucosamine--N-acetylmuramyl-(pentapeptide) pyrophosphoryl-undecaprenol N-acetylglucosamine transferase